MTTPVSHVPTHLLGDHAGHAAMNAASLTGGQCGALCDGGNMRLVGELGDHELSFVIRQ
ncbi:MAG: hypothetical protein JWO36_1500 [Myxococcales bacterium]|nr:hypothetical protein [Myxococcales bacterium]